MHTLLDEDSSTYTTIHQASGTVPTCRFHSIHDSQDTQPTCQYLGIASTSTSMAGACTVHYGKEAACCNTTDKRHGRMIGNEAF